MTTADQITVPANWPGSDPEYYVYWALEKLKINFEYQSNMGGGRLQRGGVVIDFLLFDLGIAINVQSTYWHYARPTQRVNDQINRIMVESQGIKLIYIDEEDAKRNPIWYVREAIRGIDHSKTSR